MYFHIQNTRKGLKNVSQPLVAFHKFTAQKRVLCIKARFLKKRLSQMLSFQHLRQPLTA